MFFSFQNKIKLFVLIFFINSFVLCQKIENKSIDPVFKSLLVPGWGQHDLGYKDRSKVYLYIETGILLSFFVSTKYSNEIKRNYIAFASDHALVDSKDKDHEFWVDIGNYNSVVEYNNEHLRNREANDLYPLNTNWYWRWDNMENRNSFESKRILSDKLKLVSTFAVGGLLINHIVSSIDALYLKRKSKKNGLSIVPYLQNDAMIIGYNIVYKF
tara:strand:+ start:15269 stop:15910 length:642 start_codon:yes stop_codon:yes gene_type:complete